MAEDTAVNLGDRDRDGAPDVLESIDLTLKKILNRLPEVSEASVPESLQSLAPRLAERGRSNDSAPETPKVNLSQPDNPFGAPAKAESSESSESSNSILGWLRKIADKLTGRDTGRATAQKNVQEAQDRYDKAKANAEGANAEMNAALREHSQALKEFVRAHERGKDTTKQAEAVRSAKERLGAAQQRLRNAPGELQQAETGLAQAQTNAGNVPAVGGTRTFLSGLAKRVGLKGVSNWLSSSAHQSQQAAAAASATGTGAGVAGVAGGAAGAVPAVAIAAAAQKRANQIGEGFRDIGRADVRFMESERAGDMMSSGGQAIEGVGKVIGSPVIQTVGKFAKAIGESIEKVRKWNDQLLEGNLRFAQFSGAMASVQAEQQARQIELDRQRGDRRSGIARSHAESRFRLEESMARFEDVGAGLKGVVLTALNNFGNSFLSPLSKIVEEIARKMGLLTEADRTDENMNEWIGTIGNRTWNDALAGRPMRFGGAGGNGGTLGSRQ